MQTLCHFQGLLQIGTTLLKIKVLFFIDGYIKTSMETFHHTEGSIYWKKVLNTKKKKRFL